MTLILVEGLDRAGKTTRCRELMAEPRARPRVMLHFVAPPRGVSVYEKRAASSMVLKEILFAYGMAADNPDVDFVLDRGHISWFAYEELLRGGAWSVDLRMVEDAAKGTGVRIEYVQVTDALALARRDDGHSTYTPPKGTSSEGILRRTAENIARETEAFERLLARTSWPVCRVVTG